MNNMRLPDNLELLPLTFALIPPPLARAFGVGPVDELPHVSDAQHETEGGKDGDQRAQQPCLEQPSRSDAPPEADTFSGDGVWNRAPLLPAASVHGPQHSFSEGSMGGAQMPGLPSSCSHPRLPVNGHPFAAAAPFPVHQAAAAAAALAYQREAAALSMSAMAGVWCAIAQWAC